MREMTRSDNAIRRRTCIVVCMFFCALIAAVFITLSPSKAYADLKVYVGYAGGPYYEKAYFTENELWELTDPSVYEYFTLDKGGYLRKAYGQGVQIRELLNAAGVDDRNMFRLYFRTADGDPNSDGGYLEDDHGPGSNNPDWNYESLCRTNRFYYEKMHEFVTFNEYGHVRFPKYPAIRDLENSGQYVPSILALRSTFTKITKGYGEDPDQWDKYALGTSAGYRLLYGQTYPEDAGAGQSAQLVRSIVCILGGGDGKDLPTIVIPDDAKEALENGVIGTTIKFRPGLDNAHDQVIADLGWKDINFNLDDNKNNGVYEITRIGEGWWQVTIIGSTGGSAGLTGEYGEGIDGYRTVDEVANVFGIPGSGGDPNQKPGNPDNDDNDSNNNVIASGDSKGIKLEAGTKLFNAQMSGEQGNNGGETTFTNDNTQGDQQSDTPTDPVEVDAEIDPTELTSDELEQYDPQVYELEFDQVPLAEPEPQQQPWNLGLFGMGLLFAGGLVRVGRFGSSLDREVSLQKNEAA